MPQPVPPQGLSIPARRDAARIALTLDHPAWVFPWQGTGHIQRLKVVRVELYGPDEAPLGGATVVTDGEHPAWVAELGGTDTTVVAFAEDGTRLEAQVLPTFSEGRLDWDATGPTTTTGG